MEKQCRASKERCTLKGGEKWEGNKVKRETRQKIEAESIRGKNEICFFYSRVVSVYFNSRIYI